MMTQNDMSIKSKPSLRLLFWKQPTALWLIPLIALFIMSSVPLFSSPSHEWNLGSHVFVLIVMSFVVAHRFFSFMHDTAASDFFFALPYRREALFFHMNLAAITYLIGPSALIAALNTLIDVLQPSRPWVAEETSFFSLFSITSDSTSALSILALYLQIIALFLFLELFYLLTDRTGRANTMALLINLFWPIALLLYFDATARFLPGFPGMFEMPDLYDVSWNHLLIFQALSPLSTLLVMAAASDQFWVYLILPAVSYVLCRHLFIRRQAEFSRLSTEKDWSFAITQWIGVLSVTLLGGYACHFIRLLIYSGSETGLLRVSPTPFLIGCGLGLILSLWIFNLIHGKGKLSWKPLLAGFLAVVIPFSAWLGVVMTGANGYSERWVADDQIQSIDIRYSNDSPFAQKTGYRVVTLRDRDDLRDFSALVRAVLDEQNEGLQTPRTLQSRTLSDAHVLTLLNPNGENDNMPYAYAQYDSATFMGMPLQYNAVEVTCHTKDGASFRRNLVVPFNPADPHYRDLLQRNSVYLLAEYGSTPFRLTCYEERNDLDFSYISGVIKTSVRVETVKENLTEEESVWRKRLTELTSGKRFEDFRRYERFAQGLAQRVSQNVLRSDAESHYEALMEKAPFVVRVDLAYQPYRAGSDPWTSELVLPIDLGSKEMRQYLESSWSYAEDFY